MSVAIPQGAAPLVATDLHRTYHLGGHDLPVLKGVDLTVAPGEKIFLCGASGSGKTTLLYVLGGLEKPSQGDVLVHGQSLYHAPADVRAATRNRMMGFVFQHYFLLPELTALENVLLPAMIGGKVARERALELLDKVGLSQRLDHLPTELSGGEQQRVAIARALINDPGILYADEPTGNLDAKTGGGVIDMLLKVVEESRKTLIVVTHDTQLAKRGDRLLHLKEGVLVAG
ncbi:MAG: ABC transporter ATP-binding protein [Verrucomicrobiales bacterium]|nr:ABC transporter ATP-binding protein [Verrucomicrobiales bacterium]MCP5560157.1 ABC transporter ATP-binding protein [Verrucomicrobiaceae bacterium]